MTRLGPVLALFVSCALPNEAGPPACALTAAHRAAVFRDDGQRDEGIAPPDRRCLHFAPSARTCRPQASDGSLDPPVKASYDIKDDKDQ